MSKPSYTRTTDRYHQVPPAVDIREIHRAYRENGGTVDRDTFGKVIKVVNEEIIASVFSGEFIRLPFNMGEIGPYKVPVEKKFVDGKVKTNASVNWYETIKLWKDEPSARAKGKKIYFDTKWKGRITYLKSRVRYRNIGFYKLRFYDRIEREFAKLLVENKTDAYLYGN